MKLRKIPLPVLAALTALPMGAGAEPAKNPQGLSVTVVPFEAVGNVDRAVAQVIASQIEIKISEATEKTVSQGTLNANAFVQACGQETCELKTTHKLRGSVAVLGSQYLLNVFLEAQDTGRKVYSGSRKLPQNEDSLLAAVEDLARDIVECLNGKNCVDEPRTMLVNKSPEMAMVADGRSSADPKGMVTVPAGTFLFGESKTPAELAAFRIDKAEVTAGAYAKCVEAGRCSKPADQGESCTYGVPGKKNHPINCVNWNDATAYCAWMEKRLPTEQEWEKAARGTEGRTYPWGETDVGKGGKKANAADISFKGKYSDQGIIEGYDDGYVETSPVCSFPEGNSPYEICDMVGNVLEWTSDLADREHNWRVLRGGCWRSDAVWTFRVDFRPSGEPSNSSSIYGFRCAQDVE